MKRQIVTLASVLIVGIVAGLLLSLAIGDGSSPEAPAVTAGPQAADTPSPTPSLQVNVTGTATPEQLRDTATAEPSAQGRVPEVYREVSGAVALITARGGTGTGFVVDAGGHILTNHHVVRGNSEVQVTFPAGQTLVGRVTGTDPGDDLAVVDVDLPEGVTPLRLGDSSKLVIGETVIAIGNPFGLSGTLTVGVVSGLGRSMTTDTGRTVRDAIQTDAAINPGNSGGPLLNLAGEVIGINAQIENPTGGGNIGIGFAVPVNTAKRYLPQMIRGEHVRHAYLGISGTVVDLQMVTEYGLAVDHGVVVTGVTPGGPGDRGGLRSGSTPRGADIIIGAGGSEVRTFEDLTAAIDAREPGDAIELRVQRGDEAVTVTVTLGEWPS